MKSYGTCAFTRLAIKEGDEVLMVIPRVKDGHTWNTHDLRAECLCYLKNQSLGENLESPFRFVDTGIYRGNATIDRDSNLVYQYVEHKFMVHLSVARKLLKPFCHQRTPFPFSPEFVMEDTCKLVDLAHIARIELSHSFFAGSGITDESELFLQCQILSLTKELLEKDAVDNLHKLHNIGSCPNSKSDNLNKPSQQRVSIIHDFFVIGDWSINYKQARSIQWRTWEPSIEESDSASADLSVRSEENAELFMYFPSPVEIDPNCKPEGVSLNAWLDDGGRYGGHLVVFNSQIAVQIRKLLNI